MRKVYLKAIAVIRPVITAIAIAMVILCLTSFFQVISQNTKENPTYSKWNVFYILVNEVHNTKEEALND